VACYAFDEVLHLETWRLISLSHMALPTDTANLKVLSYAAIFDNRSRMSGRVASAIIYVVMRAGDVIDWWFPVKHVVV